MINELKYEEKGLKVGGGEGRRRGGRTVLKSEQI